MEDKSVLVGMSGGIDSTAVCRILLSQSYRVVGLTLVTCDASLKAAAEAKAHSTEGLLEAIKEILEKQTK